MEKKRKKAQFMSKFEWLKMYISFIILDVCQIYNDTQFSTSMYFLFQMLWKK